MSGLGVRVRFADASDSAAFTAAVCQDRPAAVIVETLSNPLLKIPDLTRLSDVCRSEKAALIVDNTFTTPYLCRPLTLGADYVVHSATKYLGGHGDVLGGVVVTSAERRKSLFEINKMVGANLGPQEAWLVLRGVKTLPLRVQRHCENAASVAAWLAARPEVERVNYPGLRRTRSMSSPSACWSVASSAQ